MSGAGLLSFRASGSAWAIPVADVIEILEAPREYGLACGSELLEEPICIARRGAAGGLGAADPARHASGRKRYIRRLCFVTLQEAS